MLKINTPRFLEPLVLSVLLTLSLAACTTTSKTASDAPIATVLHSTTSAKIEPLALQIKGVKDATVKAVVKP